MYQNSLGKFREIGDRGGEAMSLKMIGVVKFYQGKAQEIFPYWEKELSIHRELGNKRFEGHTLNNIGNIYQNLADYQKALIYFEDALKIFRIVGDSFKIFYFKNFFYS